MFMDDITIEGEDSFDPTGTTEIEDKSFMFEVLEMLISELNLQDRNMGEIIQLLADGYQKNEILEKVDLKKGKTQGYAFIKKTQNIALNIYISKYRR